MQTSCEKCGKRYEINPSHIQGRNAKFKCKGCGHIITITKYSEIDEESQSDLKWTEPASPFSATSSEPAYVTQDLESLTVSNFSISRGPEESPLMGLTGGKLEFKGLSLKSKITLVMVVLVFISLAVIGLIASYQSHRALSKQAEVSLLQTAAQKSNEYEQIFNRIKEELNGMAAYSALILERKNVPNDIEFDLIVYGEKGPAEGQELAALTKEHKEEILKIQRIGPVLHSVVSNNPYLSLGYISTDTALTLFDNLDVLAKIRTVKEFHPHKRPWFIKAKEAGRTIWTDLYVDVATDELTVTCASPVFLKNKTFKGVIGFDVLLQTIKKDILALNIGYNSYAFLVNKAGKVLVKPDIQKGNLKWDSTVQAENYLETSNAQFNSIVKNMIEMKQGVGTYVSDEGERYIAYSPIKAMDVSMGIVAFKNEVVKPATDMRNMIILVLFVVLVFAVIIGILLGNAITKPINRLILMADLMSQGQMDLDVLKEDRDDELGVLTRSFNRLIISLKMALSR